MTNKKYSLEWKGRIYDCVWSDETNFEDLSPVLGTRGFVFNDNKEICIVKVSKEKNWADLGGGMEDFDKTFEDCFIREVDEEADIELRDLKRLGYVKITRRGKPKSVHYQLKFVAKVKNMKPRTLDPAYNRIPEIKFVKPEEFIKYTKWSNKVDWQIKKALDKLKENEKKSN